MINRDGEHLANALGLPRRTSRAAHGARQMRAATPPATTTTSPLGERRRP